MSFFDEYKGILKYRLKIKELRRVKREWMQFIAGGERYLGNWVWRGNAGIKSFLFDKFDCVNLEIGYNVLSRVDF